MITRKFHEEISDDIPSGTANQKLREFPEEIPRWIAGETAGRVSEEINREKQKKILKKKNRKIP